jgi:hypothetical protein
MPTFDAQLGAAVQDLKKSLTKAQLDQVFDFLKLAFKSYEAGKTIQPDKPLPVKVVK